MTIAFSVAIPARFGASRLPGKPLRLLNGRPMIAHVVDRALAAGAAEVVVATDDARIAAAVQGSGAIVCMTRAEHPSGTDRLAEVAQQLRRQVVDTKVARVFQCVQRNRLA
jgi:3-deoxy-manno-octulosonate cytidylyltransferase (CMP-KDO synthetase)